MLVRKYSIEGLFTELEKLKLVILPDGRKIVAESTKRQNDILKALGLCVYVSGNPGTTERRLITR